MLQKIYIISLLLLGGIVSVHAQQKTDRDYLRSGNKLYNDSLFIKAEVDYRKALDINPKSTDAMFNLGNALLMQQKAKEAMEQYESVSKIEKDKSKLAEIYHNMGVILQSAKQYPQCIEAYKESLRNNPKDDETRYNLALAQKLLKDQEQQNQNQDQHQCAATHQHRDQQTIICVALLLLNFFLHLSFFLHFSFYFIQNILLIHIMICFLHIHPPQFPLH